MACASIGAARAAGCLPHRFVFVGGLQRSGTSTLAALLQALPNVSGLVFDARSVRHMEAAPWKRVVDAHTGRWMKWAYFKEVCGRCRVCSAVGLLQGGVWAA